MDKIEKRNEIRIDNQIEIINLLRRSKRTTTELAKRLGVSFTAISNIIDELVKNNLIKYSSKKESKTRGRNPVFVELNCDEGVICCVDLSSYFIRIVIASLDNQIIMKKKELEDVTKQFDIYKAKMEALLISQLEILKDINED